MELSNAYRTLRVSRHRQVLRVVLARPERANTIDDELLAELLAVLDEAEQDGAVRLLALAAEGEIFCNGMDFAAAAGSDREDGDLATRGGEVFYGLLSRLASSPLVVVSLVDGRVAGGGVGLVAATDFVFATERSSFALPEALWGLLPACVLPFLIRRVGHQPATALTLSTLPITAERAERIHLVDELTDAPDAALRRLAARTGRLDGGIVGEAKHYVERLRAPAGTHRESALNEFARLMSSPVVRARIAGFADRRQMPWESS